MPARADPSNDPAALLERRRAQNRLAQRRFREKKLALKSHAEPARTKSTSADVLANDDAADAGPSAWPVGQWGDQYPAQDMTHNVGNGASSGSSHSGSSSGSPPAPPAPHAASGLPTGVPDFSGDASQQFPAAGMESIENLQDLEEISTQRAEGTLNDIFQGFSAFSPAAPAFDFLGSAAWPSSLDASAPWASSSASGLPSQQRAHAPQRFASGQGAPSPASTFYQQATWCPRTPSQCQPLDQMLARACLTPRQAGALFLELAQKVTQEKGLLAIILEQSGGLSIGDLRQPLHDIIDDMESSHGRGHDGKRGRRSSYAHATADNLTTFGSFVRSNPTADRLSGLYPRFDFAKVLYINAVTIGFREDDLRSGGFDGLSRIWQGRSQPQLAALQAREEIYDSDESNDSDDDDDDPRLYAGLRSASSSSTSGSLWQATVTPANMTKADERRRLRRLRDAPHVHPTPIQLAYPHSVLVDVLPWPAVRDELILLATPTEQLRDEHRARDPKASECWKRSTSRRANAAAAAEDPSAAGTAAADDDAPHAQDGISAADSSLDLVEVKCDLIGLPFGARGEGHTFRIHGDDPLDPYAWEVPEEWTKKYLRLGVRSLLDCGVVRRANWWRRMRGLPDMDLDDEVEMLRPRRKQRRGAGGHDDSQRQTATATATTTTHTFAPAPPSGTTMPVPTPASAAGGGAYPAPPSSTSTVGVDPFTAPVWGISNDGQEDLLRTAASMAMF